MFTRPDRATWTLNTNNQSILNSYNTLQILQPKPTAESIFISDHVIFHEMASKADKDMNFIQINESDGNIFLLRKMGWSEPPMPQLPGSKTGALFTDFTSLINSCATSA